MLKDRFDMDNEKFDWNDNYRDIDLEWDYAPEPEISNTIGADASNEAGRKSKFIDIYCPNCGAKHRIAADTKSCFCIFCGQEYTPEEAMQKTIDSVAQRFSLRKKEILVGTGAFLLLCLVAFVIRPFFINHPEIVGYINYAFRIILFLIITAAIIWLIFFNLQNCLLLEE